MIPVSREMGEIDEEAVLADAEKFTLAYTLRDDTYELYDEQQILYPPDTRWWKKCLLPLLPQVGNVPIP